MRASVRACVSTEWQRLTRSKDHAAEGAERARSTQTCRERGISRSAVEARERESERATCTQVSTQNVCVLRCNVVVSMRNTDESSVCVCAWETGRHTADWDRSALTRKTSVRAFGWLRTERSVADGRRSTVVRSRCATNIESASNALARARIQEAEQVLGVSERASNDEKKHCTQCGKIC